MRKIYLKTLVTIIILLWAVYFIQSYFVKNEGFTSQISSMYRPYIRTMNNHYETFVSNYGPKIIINKLRKWNIY